MILKSLWLKNIRSYINEKLDFPPGSLLLSGDIGTGKSTILLAVEFALFGIQRGALSGHTLLRAGKNEGSVELTFIIAGKGVIIKRTLKRVKESIVQSAGYIIIDGEIQDCTAVELKTRILDLLGYPKDLVTKKLLIYRYTVYTPQEEMKQILLEDKETRVDILRKVFNIDKYKKIKENTQIYIRELKERQRRYEAISEDFIDVKKDLKIFCEKKEGAERELKKLKPVLSEAKKNLEKQREKLNELEKNQKRMYALKQEFESLGIELKHALHRHNIGTFQIEDLQKRLPPLESELGSREPEKNISTKIKIKQEEIALLERNTKAISGRLGELTEKQTHSLTTVEKIKKLNNCPVCLQNVALTHKQYIINKEKKNLDNIDELMAQYDKDLKETETRLRLIKEELEQLKMRERDSALIRIKLKNLAEKKEQLKQLQDEQTNLKKKTDLINSKKSEIYEQLKNLKDSEDRYLDEKERLDVLISKEREAALKNVLFIKEHENFSENIKRLEIDFRKKQKSKELLEKSKKTRFWLDNNFLVLVDLIEKQVMANVHYKFNDIFIFFFKKLLEDENTSARLDDTFTPILIQNGYEVGIENLSGGEKTSCALAYRLALNKVINDILSTIQTRDLLILDEPTDGFSTEQLDNLKKVLDRLSTKQTIIVSHEPKIESFVDNIIEISKLDHISSSHAR